VRGLREWLAWARDLRAPLPRDEDAPIAETIVTMQGFSVDIPPYVGRQTKGQDDDR
jgi:hypothetical protein